MKKLSVFNKIFFVFNVLLATLTIIAYILPFLTPKSFPFLAVLTLFLPMILILNILFLIFWGIQLKRQVLLSTAVLIIGFPFINKFYKLSTTDLPVTPNDFVVMSYNVRIFNKFQWSDKRTVAIEIADFVKEKKPDILCIQEFSYAKEFDYSAYKYKYILSSGDKIKTGQAIFSKFKIVKKGEIKFPNSLNNVIYVDLINKNDTVRVYSMHLQSMRISPDVQGISQDINEINQHKSIVMFKQISKAFKIQQQQAELIKENKLDCKHPIIICGDMNNSAFSYVYRVVKGDLQDAFEESGTGFGKSYDFNYYPARIDYIFADKSLKIKYFQNFPEIEDSDHFPIIARMAFEKD